MSYFNYHARNKHLIKIGLLENYFYDYKENKKVLVLLFKDGRKFYVKEDRWIEYYDIIDKYFEGRGTI